MRELFKSAFTKVTECPTCGAPFETKNTAEWVIRRCSADAFHYTKQTPTTKHAGRIRAKLHARLPEKDDVAGDAETTESRTPRFPVGEVVDPCSARGERLLEQPAPIAEIRRSPLGAWAYRLEGYALWRNEEQVMRAITT